MLLKATMTTTTDRNKDERVNFVTSAHKNYLDEMFPRTSLDTAVAFRDAWLEDRRFFSSDH